MLNAPKKEVCPNSKEAQLPQAINAIKDPCRNTNFKVLKQKYCTYEMSHDLEIQMRYSFTTKKTSNIEFPYGCQIHLTIVHGSLVAATVESI
jgi:hypothetical protein